MGKRAQSYKRVTSEQPRCRLLVSFQQLGGLGLRVKNPFAGRGWLWTGLSGARMTAKDLCELLTLLNGFGD